MGRYSKGEISRVVILVEARKLFNAHGVDIGFEFIAKQMGLSRGRITHFFPTKDSLMVGIMRDYEFALGEVLMEFDWNKGSQFDQLFAVLDVILDLQYEYRCAHAYLAAVGKDQPELRQHVEASYFNRVDGIRARIKGMVESKILEARILQKFEMDIFLFQYTNLLTTWMISQEMYHKRTPYRRMKKVYLFGAMQIFVPYLTESGKKAYQQASGQYVRKSSRPAQGKK
jgi:AcrR family transcriptional regulator